MPCSFIGGKPPHAYYSENVYTSNYHKEADALYVHSPA